MDISEIKQRYDILCQEEVELIEEGKDIPDALTMAISYLWNQIVDIEGIKDDV